MQQPSEAIKMAEIVDVIFTKLSLYYGRDFLARWEGIDIDMVKDDWAHELAGIKPSSIQYALRNLPPRAPHVGEFRQIALRAPAPQMPRLEAPAFDKGRARKAINDARELLKRGAK